nr:AraC family ligand binding domain-containing protein [Brevibacillus reuszeri]
MDKFIYKKSAGVTALSASMTDFTYKKHSHKEYALGVTLRGIQEYNLDGSLQLSYQNGVMLFNPEQTHDGMAHDETGLDYVMVYIDPQLFLEISEQKECGFSDLTHLNKHFKRVYGTTAFEYMLHVNAGFKTSVYL